MKKFTFVLLIILLVGCSSNKSVVLQQQKDAPAKVNNIENNVSRPKNGVTTPILIKNFLMGGLINGEWVKYDEFYNSKKVNLDGFEYDVYQNNKKVGTAKGTLLIHSKSGEVLRGDEYQEEYDLVKLYDKNKKEVNYDIALKASWSLFPRQYKSASASQKAYENIIKEALDHEGLQNSDVKIKQIIKADLDGNGTDEVIIAADNTINDRFETTKKDDAAIIIFRNIVDGKVHQQIIDKDIILNTPEYESPYRFIFRVETIADLDGDGIMEVVIKSWYYEGEEWVIYKLTNNRLELITGNGWGA